MTKNILNIKDDFPIFKNQKKLIYFDSASTTQKPNSVINKITEFYSYYNANIHRGTYSIAEKSTFEYESVRKETAKFINSKPNEIIFTKGATESINLIAYSLSDKFKEGDEILISEMEHHSNIIPWQMLIAKKNIKLKYIPINKDGELDISQINKLINDKTKLISITHMSNVIGTINPIKKIINIAKKHNILVLIDAAQSISHIKIDVQKLDCDFLVFSSHKMMGPTGLGVLYINERKIHDIEPFLRGGQMIKEVKKNTSIWNDPPWKFEAGTSNIAQVIAFGEAIKYILSTGLQKINNHEQILLKYFLEQLKLFDNIKIYGHKNHAGPIISFNFPDCHSFDIAKLLDTFGIAIRSGHHCAQPLMKSLNSNYTNRVSLYAYNNLKEIDYFVESLKKVLKILK